MKKRKQNLLMQQRQRWMELMWVQQGMHARHVWAKTGQKHSDGANGRAGATWPERAAVAATGAAARCAHGCTNITY
jgi:hypothetical protein